MRLILLTILTMIAFAANSLLNRAGILAGADPVAFGAVRLISGALVLCALAFWNGKALRLTARSCIGGVLALLGYIYGFSLAYRGIDAGIGALILFGTVQVTMFAGAILGGETLPRNRAVGALIASFGLVWLLWPIEGAKVALGPGLFMLVAGISWGGYSLLGRKAGDPLATTAANFLLAAVPGLFLLGVFQLPSGAALSLAIASGAVTSGLGYALWYALLPQLGAGRAAVAQTTVPVLALVGGVMLLGEVPGLAILLPAAVVLAGVTISLLPQRKIGSSGS